MARSFRQRTGGGRGERRGADRAARAAERPSLYHEVTQRIVGELEQGRLPWVRPWDASGLTAGLPRNAISGRTYSGINILILWGAAFEHQRGTQGWLTFKQALSAGGHVRKGEHGATAVYADRFTPEAERSSAAEEQRDARTIPFLKRFTLFNLDQIDWPEGLPSSLVAAAPPLPEREIEPLGDALIASTGADFRIGGDQAFYSPGADYVQVPPQPVFRNQIDWYRTAFHELGHWTGHPSRLDRDQSGRFGTPTYAREELVAELASAFLCASLRIVPTVRHADYLASWLDLLRSDERAIFRAATQASRASEHLIGLLERQRGEPVQ